MKTLFIIILLFMGISQEAVAQADSLLKMRDVFISMPDSLLPTLSHNNKLDLVDFYESSMKAEVKNSFDGLSELLLLTNDSLTLRVSKALTVDLLLLPVTGAPIDSCQQVVGMVERFGTQPDAMETRVTLYSLHWRPLEGEIPLSPATRQRLSQRNTSTILKWKLDSVNKQ